MSAKILSWDEKKSILRFVQGCQKESWCCGFQTRHLRGTSRPQTHSSVLNVEEVVGCERDTTTEVRIASKIEARNGGIVGSFLRKLYKHVFPRYDFEIQVDLSDTSVNLAKARELVVSLESRKIDMEPFVCRETLHDLMRMENAAKGATRSTELYSNWTR